MENQENRLTRKGFLLRGEIRKFKFSFQTKRSIWRIFEITKITRDSWELQKGLKNWEREEEIETKEAKGKKDRKEDIRGGDGAVSSGRRADFNKRNLTNENSSSENWTWDQILKKPFLNFFFSRFQKCFSSPSCVFRRDEFNCAPSSIYFLTLLQVLLALFGKHSILGCFIWFLSSKCLVWQVQ